MIGAIHAKASLDRFSFVRAFLAVAVFFGAFTLEVQAESSTLPLPGVAPILSGCESDYPPYCIVTPDNRADGFSVELLRAALKAVGREVVYSTGSAWTTLKQDLADGRIQVLPRVARTPEREALFDFTFPYLTMHGTIVVREDCTTILAPSDLKGKQVAVLQGDNAEEYLNRANLGANIVTRTSFETALRELSDGQHDAVVIQKLLALQLMQQVGLTNLVTVGPPLQDFTQSFCFAVRKGDAKLLAALNEGLSIVIADGTFRTLHSKWFPAREALGHSKSRIIIGGDSDYPPYEYLDKNGQPAGFNVAITRAIARQMGLQIEIRLGSWNSIRKELGSGNIDLVQGMLYSVERDQEFSFSTPYAVIQHAIVVRTGTAVPADIQDLAGKSILVIAGDIMEDLAKAHGYGRQLVAVPSQEEALRQLAAGNYDCALVPKVPALYWIEKKGWHNLIVSEQQVSSAEYCYAVLKGQEELLSHLSEGLAALKANGEYRRIQSEWLMPYEDAKMPWRTVVKYSLVVILPLIALLLASFLWSRSLRRQVAIRTQALQQEITTRKEMDTKLIEALNQAEAGNRAKSEFLGIMSHELRTPLNGVLGSAELLTYSSLDPEQKSLVETVSQCGEHLLAIVTDILDFSSMEAGKLVCHVEPIAVAEVVEQSTSAVQKSAADKALAFRCEIRRDVPRQITGDALRIRQILINLLANAIKFTSSGSVVLHVTPSAEGQFLDFSVEDTGIGISSETIEHLFLPFTQADSTMTRAFGGTGLGLTISKRLAEAMGGSITVASIPDKGSTFTFHFPLESALAGADGMTAVPFPISNGDSYTSAQTQPRPPIQTSGPPAVGKLVLVVEDDYENSTLAGKMLQSLGYHAEFAADGAKAVQAFEPEKYFAILMDLVMPRLNGVEATKKIRELEATAGWHVPIIALTANVTPADRELCRAAGMNDFLTKPFKRAELASALASIAV
ncbi:transporter substrate-binding domain-containing protein [Coraliomargarita sp. W4R53]